MAAIAIWKLDKFDSFIQKELSFEYKMVLLSRKKCWGPVFKSKKQVGTIWNLHKICVWKMTIWMLDSCVFRFLLNMSSVKQIQWMSEYQTPKFLEHHIGVWILEFWFDFWMIKLVKIIIGMTCNNVFLAFLPVILRHRLSVLFLNTTKLDQFEIVIQAIALRLYYHFTQIKIQLHFRSCHLTEAYLLLLITLANDNPSHFKNKMSLFVPNLLALCGICAKFILMNKFLPILVKKCSNNCMF
jgi:hypothetical protein